MPSETTLQVAGNLLCVRQHRVGSGGFAQPRRWDSFEPDLGSDARPNEGSSAAGAPSAAHGVSDGRLKLFGCQDSMQRRLECTWQTSCVGEHSGDQLLWRL